MYVCMYVCVCVWGVVGFVYDPCHLISSSKSIRIKGLHVIAARMAGTRTPYNKMS